MGLPDEDPREDVRVLVAAAGRHGATPVPAEALVDVDDMLQLSRAREHRVFSGRVDLGRLRFAERATVTALHAPRGDFRQLSAARAWGGQIGPALGRVAEAER